MNLCTKEKWTRRLKRMAPASPSLWHADLKQNQAGPAARADRGARASEARGAAPPLTRLPVVQTRWILVV